MKELEGRGKKHLNESQNIEPLKILHTDKIASSIWAKKVN